MTAKKDKTTNNTFELTLQDVFLLLGARERIGELTIESGNNIGTFLIYRRKILQAFSPYSRAIGDLLVENGMISESELIETLNIQKRSAYIPLGGILLKMGKVSFEIVEMMVHEQIRQAVKEYQSWNNANFSFLDKDIKPYDRIHLMLNEFIPPPTIESALAFLSAGKRSDPPLTEESAITIVNP